MEALTREKLLQRFASPALAGLVASALRPDGAWVATRYSIFAAAYNTGAVTAADVPRRYEDLRDPRWKGRLGIEADDANWFSAVVGALGEPAGLDLFRDIVGAQRHVDPQGAFAARQPGGVGRGAAGADRLRLPGRAPEEGGRADRQGLPAARDRPADRRRRGPPGAASVRRDAFRRVHADRWPGHHGATRIRGDPAGSRRHSGRPAARSISRAFLDQREKWTRLFKEIFVSQAH